MKSALRVPISFKLVLVTVALIIAVVLPVAFRNSDLFESTFSRSQDDANAELSNSKSVEVQGLIFNYLDKIKTVTSLLINDPTIKGATKEALDLVFFRDLDLVNIEIYQLKEGRPVLLRRETNEAHLKTYELDKSYLERVRREKPFPVMAVFTDRDRVHIRNAALPGGAPLFTMGVPFPDENGVIRHVAIVDVRLDRLQKAFALSGVRTLYLVDGHGIVLAHTDDKLAIEGKNVAHLPIVAEALERTDLTTKGQKRFWDPELKERFIGAYSKTPFGVTVISQAPERIILEPARLVRIEAFEVAGYVLSGALFFVILFSFSLTHPLERLHEATLIVAGGNFNVKAKVQTRDEVGDLAAAFNQMVDGLKERDKVKTILNKFHGSTITEDLLKRDLILGGNRKDVTVFFSDIRDFTKFSESHTPEEVVEMLNEYFQIMVGLISANHGIVDKFVGDAIMAVWGAPDSTGEDGAHALRACLQMRMALAELNEDRLKRGQSAIKIGMGLHSGPAISGTIGSTERMEYTVIGDTVNMASRIESSTKAFGTDLLVSETVARGLNSKFLFELAGVAEVKGKTEPIQMFRVRGYFNEKGEAVLLTTPYSDYEAVQADKVKISA